MSKSIIKNTVYKFTLSIFNIIIPLIVGRYVNGLLIKEDYGVYNDALGVFGFFLIFASFGIYNYGIREISKVRDDKKKLKSLFSNLFCFGVVTNVVVSLLYLFYVMFLVEGSQQAIFYTMLIQVVANTFLVEWVNEAVEAYGFITIKTVVVRIISTVLLFLVVTKPEHTFIYAVLIALTAVANNVSSFVYIRKKVGFDFTDIHLLRYIKPLSLLLIISNINVLYIQLDRILLGRVSESKVPVSEYWIPANLTNTVIAVVVSLIAVTIPRLNYYFSNNKKDEYNSLLEKSSRSYFMLIFPACVGIFTLGYEIMMIYGTENYVNAYPVLQAFAVRFMIMSVYTIYANQIMYIHNKEKQLVLMLFAGGALNAVFKVVLFATKQLTPLTAIMTTVVAEVVLLSLLRRYIAKNLDVEFDIFSIKNMKYLYISFTFVPIVYGIKAIGLGVLLNCIIAVPLCCLVYFAILYFTKDDMLMLYVDKLKARLIKK